jgi:hypothetical protein
MRLILTGLPSPDSLLHASAGMQPQPHSHAMLPLSATSRSALIVPTSMQSR